MQQVHEEVAQYDWPEIDRRIRLAQEQNMRYLMQVEGQPE